MPDFRFVEPLENRLFLSRIEGIDVSQYQGTMNFSTAYNANKRFAFIRASRSDTVPDTRVSINVPNAKAAGLVVGVYHRALPFSTTPDTNNASDFRDPIVDADSFISAGGAYMGNGYMRPVVDVENGASLNTTSVNGYTLNQWVVAFINRIKERKGVTPIVYCNTNYANIMNKTVSTQYPSVPANAPDIWIANWTTTTYGDPINGTGNPPQGAWGTGSGWDFWQYSSTGTGSTHGAASTYIDLNVFNGSDINVLKQNFVIGAAKIPTNPSPSNGAGGVNRTNLKLDWSDSVGAAGYDVYLNRGDGTGEVRVATNITASEWTVSPQSTAGLKNWRVVAKGVITDTSTHVSGPAWSFTVASLPAPAVPSSPTPNGTIVTTKPVLLDWADSTNATSYEVVQVSGSPAVTTTVTTTVSQLSVTPSSDGVHQWRVNAINADGTTAGAQWSYTLDTVAPTATYGAQTPVAGNQFLDFTITYSDATSGVNVSSLDGGDVTVTGPNSFSADATFIGVNTATNGSTRIATYRITAPGGYWNLADNGTYTVKQNASQVFDVGGLSRASGTIGTFTANVAFAYKLGTMLRAEFDGTTTPIALAHAGGIFSATRNGVTLNFTGVTNIEAAGTSSVDQLDLNGAIPVPLSFAGGSGNDVLRVVAGTYTFDSDVAAGAPNVLLRVMSGATAVFNASQHLRELDVAGTAQLTSGGEKVLVTRALSISGQLDLTDNDLLLNYTGPSPTGAWSEAEETYTGVFGMVRSGLNDGGWQGNGLITSQDDALRGRTTLGVAEASAVLEFADGATDLYGGEVVDDTTVIVKYTWSGDANLDGRVDADDYAAIDTNYRARGPKSYPQGDFNYDGGIDADDYSWIDTIYRSQDRVL